MNFIKAYRNYLIPVIIIAAGLLITVWLSSMKKEQKRSAPRAFVRTVETKTVEYGPVVPQISGMGRVRPMERIALNMEVSGIALEKDFFLRKGTNFLKGQVVLRIDNRQALYGFNSSVADLQNAMAGFLGEIKADIPQSYQKWQEFFTELSENKIPDLPEMSSQREKLFATRFNVLKLYYNAKNQKLILDKHVYHATFAGTVEDAAVFPGSMVRSGTTIATLARTDMAEIEISLPISDIPNINVGSIALVLSDNRRDTLQGRIERISNVMDERMQTVPVFISVRPSFIKGLLSGSYPNVVIQGKEISRGFVLERKVLHNDNFLYVIEDGRLIEKQVQIVHSSMNTVIIEAGLNYGDIVVSEALQGAVIGMAVRPAGNINADSGQLHKQNKK